MSLSSGRTGQDDTASWPVRPVGNTVRDEREAQTFWIDAICVDQQNLKERSPQVQRKCDVFTSAKRVIVWLGHPALDSSLALRELELLSSKVALDENGEFLALSQSIEDLYWTNPREALPWDSRTWRAVRYLFIRPWFRRLWIWQEIAVARRDARMILGYDSISWSSFRAAVRCLLRKELTLPFELSVSLRYVTQIAMLEPNNSLFEMLCHSINSHCLDPRDRIYALLGIVSGWEMELGIVPNYTASVRDVYIDFAVRYMKTGDSLQLMHLCGLRELQAGWPTWVPNRLASADLTVTSHCVPGRRTPCYATYVRDGILEVIG